MTKPLTRPSRSSKLALAALALLAGAGAFFMAVLAGQLLVIVATWAWAHFGVWSLLPIVLALVDVGRREKRRWSK